MDISEVQAGLENVREEVTKGLVKAIHILYEPGADVQEQGRHS